LNRNLSTHG